MKQILVTGGCGFIGSHFVRRMLLQGDSRIVNLDLLTYAGNPANLSDVTPHPQYEFIKGDIGDEAMVARVLEEFRIDAVVNFAAESHVDRSIDSPEPFVQTNVVGTLRLLNAARQHWQKLGEPKRASFRFLHVSTDEVYGSLGPMDAAFNERTAYSPNSPYAASKAASDHLVRAVNHTYGLPTVITNCSNNYGPYQFPEKLIPLVILNALEGKLLPVYGDGQQIRDWLFVEDHVAALDRVLRKGKPGETYNIGGRSEKTNLEIVKTLCERLDESRPRADGKSYADQITFVADRPGHDRRYAIDDSKLQAELDVVPQTSFSEGIRKTVEWYLTHLEWAADITQKRYARERLGQGN